MTDISRVDIGNALGISTNNFGLINAPAIKKLEKMNANPTGEMGYDMDSEEMESGFWPFDAACRRDCKEKLGGKGMGFRDCLRECRGGKRFQKQKEKQDQTELLAKILETSQNTTVGGGSTLRTEEETGGSKTWIWVTIIAVVFLAAMAGLIIYVKRKKK